MISTQDVKIQAQHPSMPLSPFVAFKNSPSSIRILDVPKKIGLWNITSVQIQVTYPDSQILSKQCVRTGNVWVGTLEGTSSVGQVCKGYQITASGVDEDGNEISGYVLGVGDIIIMDIDGSIFPNETADNVRIFSSVPNDPKIGDVYLDGIALMVYDGVKWVKIGDQDLSGYVKIGNNQLQDQTISFTDETNTKSVEIAPHIIKVAKQGGGTLITHNQIWMVPDYGSAYINVGDKLYGGVVNIGENAVVIQGDSSAAVIKVNDKKVLTEENVVPDPNNQGNAMYATSSINAQHAESAGMADNATTANNAQHANTANNATTANNAEHANTADNATTANNAQQAEHANTADNATTANNAQQAEHANTANNADYALSAGSASQATKAEQDGNGNNIATTYATKTYVDEQIGHVLTQEEF